MREDGGGEFGGVCETVDVEMCFGWDVSFENPEDIFVCFSSVNWISKAGLETY
jgi:hypothetical protein